MQMKLGIIGGSGVYDITGLENPRVGGSNPSPGTIYTLQSMT